MTTRDELLAYADDPRVRAFLLVLRICEGTSGPDGYRTMFGGDLFESFADHPRKPVTKPLGRKTVTSTAAGAYQFLAGTWGRLAKAYGFPDFSPQWQDAGAVALIMGRKALDPLLDGKIDQVIDLCNEEWASLPGSPYGQPTKPMTFVLRTYAQELQRLRAEAAPAEAAPSEPIFRPDDEPAAPIENRTEPPVDFPMPGNPLPEEITGGPSMIDPISLAATLIPLAAKYLPEVAKIFGPRSEVSQRNVAIATKTLEVIAEATGSVNAQQALEKVATDPAARKAAREALVVLYDIVPVGRDGVDGARTFVAGQVSSGDLASRMVWGALVLVLAIVVVAGGGWVLREVLMGVDTTAETRAQITGYFQNAGLIVLGFVFGSSVSSRRKDEKASVQ